MASRWSLSLLVALVACGEPTASPDAPPAALDAALDAPIDAIIHVDDGTPTRQPCTGRFGTALSTSFGRLDGYLVAIVPPGNGGCNADADHVHLQVRANGAVYDVAITTSTGNGAVEDVATTTADVWLTTAWAEGWHVGAAAGVLFDYPSRGLHASAFTPITRAALTSTLMTELASVNHITVFATGYGPDGVHLVHRNGSGHDGVIVTQPLSSPGRGRMFKFTDQNF